MAAWVTLAVVSLPVGEGGHGAHAGHAHVHAGGPATPATAWWVLMVVAMMLPIVRVQARWLAARSLRRMRQRVIATFAASYLLVWTLAGALALPLLGPVQGDLVALAAALAIAAAWQASPPRRRLIQRCGSIRAPAIRGPRAVAGWVKAGGVTGARCVGTCWAVMLPMAVVHHPVVMVFCAAVMFNERRPAPNADTRGARPFEAHVLAAAAFAVLFAALVRAGGGA